MKPKAMSGKTSFIKLGANKKVDTQFNILQYLLVHIW